MLSPLIKIMIYILQKLLQFIEVNQNFEDNFKHKSRTVLTRCWK